MTEAQRIKQDAIDLLATRYHEQADRLAAIDVRLGEYYEDMLTRSSIDFEDPNDLHNTMELLGALKLLRLMRNYSLNVEMVQKTIRLREGDWHQDGKRWVYDNGGLLLPGTRGATHYRWQPYQVFILTAIYGLYVWIDTQTENGTRDMLGTEREGHGGNIEDLRRLCTSFTYFAPRKTDKTGLSGYGGVLEFMLGDYDGEVYCCANSQAQSKIIFERMQGMVRSLDPTGKRIRFTATQTNWRPGQIRKAKIEALSAGGKTKDGLFASYCAKDEIGQAPYINGKSDMGALINVIESSMGPRREPLSVTTTTAGTITDGPFIGELAGIKAALLQELERDAVSNPDGLLQDPSDRWMCLLLEPDPWDIEDEERMFTSPNIWKKVNPMLGIIVQHSFYEQEIAKSRLDPLKHIETMTKLFNVYQTGRVTQWMKSDRIRPLQRERRITDCRFADGWNVFVGLDFSHGDDLFAVTYLGVNYTPNSTLAGRFFADCEAWVLEATMEQSPNRPLYEKWVEQGWLHVCPGEVFDSAYAINRLAEKNEKGINIVLFGYDAAQSAQPINNLKAWLQTLGIDATAVQQMVVPVPQTALTQNPRIGELEDMIKSPEGWLEFSESPLWPWCFGNCAVELNSSDLRRVIKSTAQAKIDPVHGLLDALYCFDLTEGKIS